MRVEVTIPHKYCLAVAMLANQRWCPVRMAEMVLKGYLLSKLLATALLHTTEGLFFEVHNPNVSGQMTRACKLSSALGIFATQLLLAMTCRALVELQVLLCSKNFPTFANLALESLFCKVNKNHVGIETLLRPIVF